MFSGWAVTFTDDSCRAPAKEPLADQDDSLDQVDGSLGAVRMGDACSSTEPTPTAPGTEKARLDLWSGTGQAAEVRLGDRNGHVVLPGTGTEESCTSYDSSPPAVSHSAYD